MQSCVRISLFCMPSNKTGMLIQYPVLEFTDLYQYKGHGDIIFVC